MRNIIVAILAGTAVLVAGVSLSQGASTKSTTSRAELSYRLKEMSLLGPMSVSAGRVTITARNGGTVEHELVVFKGSGPLVVKNFKGIEAGRWIAEIAETEPGKTASLTLNLKPGKYLLACNIVGHYQLGMKTVLTVH